MFQRFICVLTVVVMAVFTATSASAQLANSPWPMLYHDRGFTKVATVQGPESGVDIDWFRDDLGNCFANATIDSSGNLYIIMKDDGTANNFFYKLNPGDGSNLVTPVDLGVSQTLASASPFIVQTNGTDYVYTQQIGQIRKWETDLDEITTGNWPVDIEQNSVDLSPWGLNLTTDANGNGDWMIVVGSGVTKLVVFAINKGDGTKRTFDLHDWFMDHKCVQFIGGQCTQVQDTCNQAKTNCCAGSGCFYFPYTTTIVDNSSPIAIDPDNSNINLFVVILREGNIVAVKFDTSTGQFSSNPIKWRKTYSPNLSSTSPTIVVHPSNHAKDRVYFASGKETGQNATLYSRRLSDGELMASTNFDVGFIQASPVTEHITSPDTNRVYIHTTGGPTLGLEDALSSSSGQTLECKWKTAETTSKYITMIGGNGGKSASGLYYSPFKLHDDSNRYAGGFDPDANWGQGSSSPCSYASGEEIWKRSMGDTSAGDDLCTRAIGFYQSKGQVYFGTAAKFFSFEEKYPNENLLLFWNMYVPFWGGDFGGSAEMCTNFRTNACINQIVSY